MNIVSLAGYMEKLKQRFRLHARGFDTQREISTFSDTHPDSIRRIYVINLDRQPGRWRQMKRELGRMSGRNGKPLTTIARRFSAVDARYLPDAISDAVLSPYYTLADQLTVEPNPLLRMDGRARSHRIRMTPQEVAVALSHIEIWRLIADSAHGYTLVLEDDVYFRYGFANQLDSAWRAMMARDQVDAAFDLLYLSFQKVGAAAGSNPTIDGPAMKARLGVWNAAGYVLSPPGANKLLSMLPVYGPIDLWLNLRFDNLDVFTTKHSIIEQRVDVPSSNSYSVLPVLSQVGVLNFNKPLLAKTRVLPSPIFAFGGDGSGLTSLATALSMLGYTCCSDLRTLPTREEALLRRGSSSRSFNAYVNIGSPGDETVADLATIYRGARFIFTTPDYVRRSSVEQRRILILSSDTKDKWDPLTTFLGLEYPAFDYPDIKDLGQRDVSSDANRAKTPSRALKFDSSPWILSSKDWSGIRVAHDTATSLGSSRRPLHWACTSHLDATRWRLRDDTFPSNLALFRPVNVTFRAPKPATLVLRREASSVRSFTSAAIVSKQAFLYGTFGAEVRPAKSAGVVTGVFLHRNGPRQEIDIEFLGNDTTRMLVNVYYNPGGEGTKLEYGFRGTPISVDLGFDAAKDFHLYEIEWLRDLIRWRVDGNIVHERVLWDPTPIPDLPLEFNLNLWCSRSKSVGWETG